jgi:hypothetical protein
MLAMRYGEMCFLEESVELREREERGEKMLGWWYDARNGTRSRVGKRRGASVGRCLFGDGDCCNDGAGGSLRALHVG